jgi:hypothetical protein
MHGGGYHRPDLFGSESRTMSYMECPCGIHRDDCDYHNTQQHKKTCRYPDCTNKSVYFGVRNTYIFDYLCKEHYNCLQDMFKKYYILAVDLT